AQAVPSKILRLEAIEVETVLCLEKRVEKRDSLNVVPMIVGHENVRFNSAVPAPFRPPAVESLQVVAQHAQAGAAIENEVRAAGNFQLKARRVSAIAPCIALQRRRRAA